MKASATSATLQSLSLSLLRRTVHFVHLTIILERERTPVRGNRRGKGEKKQNTQPILIFVLHVMITDTRESTHNLLTHCDDRNTSRSAVLGHTSDIQRAFFSFFDGWDRMNRRIASEKKKETGHGIE